MGYRFVIHPQASDSLTSLQRDHDDRIRSKIKEMVTNEWRDLEDYDVEKVRGTSHDIYRTRIGDYRVFFLKDHPIAAILHVDGREGAYGTIDRLDDRADEFFGE